MPVGRMNDLVWLFTSGGSPAGCVLCSTSTFTLAWLHAGHSVANT